MKEKKDTNEKQKPIHFPKCLKKALLYSAFMGVTFTGILYSIHEIILRGLPINDGQLDILLVILILATAFVLFILKTSQYFKMIMREYINIYSDLAKIGMILSSFKIVDLSSDNLPDELIHDLVGKIDKPTIH
jgi:hypothetical protein